MAEVHLVTGSEPHGFQEDDEEAQSYAHKSKDHVEEGCGGELSPRQTKSSFHALFARHGGVIDARPKQSQEYDKDQTTRRQDHSSYLERG